MTIGEFSRRTRLSLKALRLYDAMGLLLPAQKDDQSGYRYYREEQAERARLIGLLRRLEMPLDEIERVLGLSGSEAARAIAGFWREVESETRTKRRLVRYLENYLEGKGENMYEIELRHVPQQKVASIQGHVNAEELPGFIGESMSALFEYIHDSGLTPVGVPFVAYHGQVDRDSDGPVETCVAFEGQLEPKGDIRIRLEPAHEEAFTRISKAQVEFPGILEAYDAVDKHLRATGKSPDGSPREVYFAAWDEIGDNDPACDIAFPFKE